MYVNRMRRIACVRKEVRWREVARCAPGATKRNRWCLRGIAAWAILVSIHVAFAAAADRPNFVWLVSEDNSKHYVRLFDPHGAPMPHIEALARHGLTFEHAFSNAPVCSVARTTLITGCYAPRIGTQYHRRTVAVPLPDGLRMFPAYLRDAGYYTTNKQKKDYNAIEGDGVWDESSPRASWRRRREGQPFFHMQSFTTTHESSLHFSAEAMRSEPTETDPASVFVAPYHPDTPTFRYTYARYADRIRQVDAQIGEVIAQLEEDGLIEDTFIFYFGDHGGVLPRSKGYLYESGLHVPLVVRIPERWKHLVDAPIGGRLSGFVSFVDFGPTLLHLAGIDVPAAMDGRPFLGPGRTLADLERRDETYGYADRFDEKYDLVRTIRKGRFKYMRSYQPFNFDGLYNEYRYKMLAYAEWRSLFEAGKLSKVQSQFFQARPAELLFDLETDPYETRNLAEDPKYAEVLTDLRGRLRAWVKGMPDLSFFPESYLVAEAFDNPVPFGQSQKERIQRLVDVADLEWAAEADFHKRIGDILRDADPWVRYWGLIACNGRLAGDGAMLESVRSLATHDPEPLVRVRAAECLALAGYDDPGPVIRQSLRDTTSGVEANLILNTVVLLRDGPRKISLPIHLSDMPRLSASEHVHVERRLRYLEGSTATK